MLLANVIRKWVGNFGSNVFLNRGSCHISSNCLDHSGFAAPSSCVTLHAATILELLLSGKSSSSLEGISSSGKKRIWAGERRKHKRTCSDSYRRRERLHFVKKTGSSKIVYKSRQNLVKVQIVVARVCIVMLKNDEWGLGDQNSSSSVWNSLQIGSQ